MDKSEARAAVWAELIKVAKPDSRFHLDFSEYIPDFEGSEAATARLTGLDIYRQARTLFITPDNCLEQLRGADRARQEDTGGIHLRYPAWYGGIIAR